MTGSPIPRIIWQTYRSLEVPPEALDCRRSWRTLNPGWDYRFMDDRAIDRFVRETVSAEVYGLFRAFPLGVMRADFWRYLVTQRHGGLYADLDTVCLVPVDEWLPNDAAFVVAPENHAHLCQWTFLTTPGHACLDAVIDLVVERAAAGIDTASEHFVHYHTGPGAWTDAIAATLDWGDGDMPAKSRRRDLPRARELGVRVLDHRAFNGDKVRHLFGSVAWGGDYDRWTEQRDGLRRRHSRNQKSCE